MTRQAIWSLQAADPLDMDLWDRLETQNPTLFAGMYHLWAQRPA